MPFQFHINILDLLCKGVMIGIIVSAPMGPGGVLCVQRTLNKAAGSASSQESELA